MYSMCLLLFSKLVAKEFKSKITLMGVEKPINNLSKTLGFPHIICLGLNLSKFKMQCKEMVNVMTINLAMSTRLARIGIASGRSRWIKTISLVRKPTTSPIFILSLLFYKIWWWTTSRFLFRPLGLLWWSVSKLTMCLSGRWCQRGFWGFFVEPKNNHLLFNHVQLNVFRNLEHINQGWLCGLTQDNVLHSTLEILI